MWDAETDDSAAFEARMDTVCREIGERGKLLVPEAVPPALASAPEQALEPAPEPAPEPVRATPPATSLAPILARMDEPTLQPSYPTRPQTVADGMPLANWLAEKLLEEVQTERAEMRAEITQLRDALQQPTSFQSELTPLDDTQLCALQQRLEGCHAQQLLKDDELWALEDLVADFVEVQVRMGAVTKDILLSCEPVAKLHNLVALSEKIQSDSAFARQAKRKALPS